MWQLGWEGVWGAWIHVMDMCICVAESPHCSPETITTLLIGYTPRQNQKFKIKKKAYDSRVAQKLMRGQEDQVLEIHRIQVTWCSHRSCLVRSCHPKENTSVSTGLVFLLGISH